MIQLTINGTQHDLDVDPDTPLLWALRDTLGLTGTKYGCGMALCGSCTVHVDGVAMQSCVLPVSALKGKSITTIVGRHQSINTSSINRSERLVPLNHTICIGFHNP